MSTTQLQTARKKSTVQFTQNPNIQNVACIAAAVILLPALHRFAKELLVPHAHCPSQDSFPRRETQPLQGHQQINKPPSTAMLSGTSCPVLTSACLVLIGILQQKLTMALLELRTSGFSHWIRVRLNYGVPPHPMLSCHGASGPADTSSHFYEGYWILVTFIPGTLGSRANTNSTSLSWRL